MVTLEKLVHKYTEAVNEFSEESNICNNKKLEAI